MAPPSLSQGAELRTKRQGETPEVRKSGQGKLLLWFTIAVACLTPMVTRTNKAVDQRVITLELCQQMYPHAGFTAKDVKEIYTMRYAAANDHVVCVVDGDQVIPNPGPHRGGL